LDHLSPANWIARGHVDAVGADWIHGFMRDRLGVWDLSSVEGG